MILLMLFLSYEVVFIIGAAPSTVTAKFMRKLLRRTGTIRTRWDRTRLLEFVLSDRKYRDLEGIALLPLNDGTWSSFSKTTSCRVYICEPEEAKVFLGLQYQVLRTDLPPSLLHSLQEVADRGRQTVLAGFLYGIS